MKNAAAERRPSAASARSRSRAKRSGAPFRRRTTPQPRRRPAASAISPFRAARRSSFDGPWGTAGGGASFQLAGAREKAASSPTAKIPSPPSAWTRRNLASLASFSSARRVRIP
ncbi:MAG: hypothetical protein IPP07_06025 [Holophagales bacterium]|nr:hypothetical protein [Holophagales bacterium]